MKKVKVVLSAIMVLALVAGAFAFESKKFTGFCVYKFNNHNTPTTSDDTCDLTYNNTRKLATTVIDESIVGAILTRTNPPSCPTPPAVADCKSDLDLVIE